MADYTESNRFPYLQNVNVVSFQFMLHWNWEHDFYKAKHRLCHVLDTCPSYNRHSSHCPSSISIVNHSFACEFLQSSFSLLKFTLKNWATVRQSLFLHCDMTNSFCHRWQFCAIFNFSLDSSLKACNWKVSSSIEYVYTYPELITSII